MIRRILYLKLLAALAVLFLYDCLACRLTDFSLSILHRLHIYTVDSKRVRPLFAICVSHQLSNTNERIGAFYLSSSELFDVTYKTMIKRWRLKNLIQSCLRVRVIILNLIILKLITFIRNIFFIVDVKSRIMWKWMYNIIQ
jgi:hypothetical protein